MIDLAEGNSRPPESTLQIQALSTKPGLSRKSWAADGSASERTAGGALYFRYFLLLS
jgi:hypothetical protein